MNGQDTVAPHCKLELPQGKYLLTDLDPCNRVCYERSVFAPTAMTYLLSATWHGFYPGYYGCFMSMTLFLLTSRKVGSKLPARRVKWYVGQNSWLKNINKQDKSILIRSNAQQWLIS